MYFILILLLSLTLTSNGEEQLPYLTSECDSLSMIEGVVNAYNGRVVQVDHDIVIAGSDPLEMTRNYDGGHHFDSEFGYGIGCSFPALIRTVMKDDKVYAYVELRQGLEILCRLYKENGSYVGTLAKEYYKTGFTNCSDGLLNGESSLYALSVEIHHTNATVTLGDGTKRHYYFMAGNSHKDGYFRLYLEERNNGNRRHFRYNSPLFPFSLEKVWTTNADGSLTLNSLDFYYENNYVFVQGSDGQRSAYNLRQEKGKVRKGTIFRGFSVDTVRDLNTQSKTNYYPPVNYDYSTHAKSLNSLFSIKKIHTSDGKYLEFESDEYKRVKELKKAGHSVPLYTFDYHTNYTDVVDAKGAKRRFEFSDRRLTQLTEPYRIQKFEWDNKGQLTKHVILSNSGQQLSQRSLKYDERGNILELQVTGTICQLGSNDKAIIKYVYDDQNRLINENQNDLLEIRTGYIDGTHLVSEKLTLSENHIYEREFYQYDKNAILTKTIKDDGSSPNIDDLSDVTYRLITEIEPQLNSDLFGLSLPKCTSEWYINFKTGKKKLLQKKEYIYGKGNLITEEKVYDSNDIYQFSNFFEYNERFQLIKEIDALGQAKVYKYNNAGQKIYEEQIGTGKKNHYVYNLADQLVEEIDECNQELKLKKTHKYDAMSNRISTRDIYGQKTKYEFDNNYREIGVTDPSEKKEHREYDAFNNPISFQDKDGYIIKTTYSLLKKPVEILYPDGSKETFSYNLQGHLTRETKRTGIRLEYSVDYKGRIVEERTYSKSNLLLKTRSYNYKGNKLISEIDALGNTTVYNYDGACRKISMTKGDVTTYYKYDTFGRLFQTIVSDSVFKKRFNYLGQIIEERIEDATGQLFSKTEFEYDVLGNQKLIRKYQDENTFAEIKTIWNGLSMPIMQIDELGNIYNTNYTFTDSLRKETVDPLNRKTVEIYDYQQRLVTQQKFSKDNILISQSNQFYDGRGNITKRIHDVIYEGKLIDQFIVNTSFDSMNHKIEEVEQESKNTKWFYKQGQLTTVINPDGVILTYKYDLSDRMKELISSDDSIHYTYTYDIGNRLLSVQDHINNLTTDRSYDAFARVISEKLGNGLLSSYAYDSQNRCTFFEFANGSVKNIYSPTTLKKSIRTINNITAYSYKQECNWLGKPVKAYFPKKTTVSFLWDLGNRCANICSRTFEQQLSYNSVGKLSETAIKDNEGIYHSIFEYDDLDQLTSETGAFFEKYAYDSVNNRRWLNDHELTVNDLNQTIKSGHDCYTYDLNGRRKSKGNIHYNYDALGRLISVSDENTVTKYIYDSFGRRIRTISQNEITDYLYHLNIEVGSYQANLMKEFRLLDEAQETLIIELEDNVYSAITNHRGDVVQLIGANGVEANYLYDAFGNHLFKGNKHSPWLFFGQRYELVADLYHFCRREYDPKLGNWITPDPLSYLDGPNLYAYVHNNPLTYVDPYGLLLAESKDWCRGVIRGAADDTSWGATEYALGGFHSDSIWGTAGYYTGTAASLVGGLAYGGTEAKIAKGFCIWLGKGISSSCQVIKNTFRATKGTAEVASNVPLKQVIEHTQDAAKRIWKANHVIANTAEARKIPLTPTELRKYLSNVKEYNKAKIIEDAEKLGLRDKGEYLYDHINMIDTRGRVRVKIHPPDPKTDYHHIHIYDKDGKPLNANLNIVKNKSPEAHIPYKVEN